MENDVNDIKTVLVTGSSRGIGKAIALEFGLLGYQVILNANQSHEELLNTHKEFLELGIICHPILADVSDYSECQKLFLKAHNIYKYIDVLINNAGISYVGLFTDMNEYDWTKILSVNLGSVINCTHLALPSMLLNHKGIIINISSMWGECGASCESIYSASKGAVNSFTKSMAKEAGPSNIRINAIACGVIETSMNEWLSKEEKNDLLNDISIMRFGKPRDVARLACFLASDDSSFLTGQILTLDGGMI